MKKITLLFLPAIIFLGQSVSGQYAHQNISMLSLWDDISVVPEPVYGIRYQGCWGWVSPVNGREYAIIGASKPGTYIIEVTNPLAPVTRDYVPGISWANHSIWHEYKSYGNYLYIASDDYQGSNTFQIADMSYLPDSVHLVHNDSTIFKRAHTIYIDGDKLYCASVNRPGGISYSMAVYSLSNPALPQLLRTLDQDYPAIGSVHDMFVRNDTVYASCGNQGLRIYKFTSGNTFTELGILPNPGGDYSHASFLSDDGTTLVNCYEVPNGLPVQLVDVTNISTLGVYSTITSADGATPHNPYIKNGKAIIAYYQDGIRVYNIDVPANPVPVGFFDTNPTNGAGLNNPGYSGCWGAYTDLPSGILLASDMQKGLFILDADSVLLGTENLAAKENNPLVVYPNPAEATIFLNYNSAKDFNALASVIDINGKVVMSRNEKVKKGMNHFSFDVSSLAEGIYALTLSGNAGILNSRKFIRE